MQTKIISTSFVLPFLWLTGCTTNYVITDPLEMPVRSHIVPVFPSGRAVELVLEKTEKETKLVNDSVNGTYFVNHQQWAATAAGLTATALKNKGMIVSDAALKSLKFYIVDVKYNSGSRSSTKVDVTLKVVAGNSYSGNYSSINNRINTRTAPLRDAGPESALARESNLALTRAVEAMLNDRAIIRYLQE